MKKEALYREAGALHAGGELTKAVTLYKVLVEKSTDARFFIAYGVCLQGLGHWKESVRQLKRGIQLKPHYCEPDARLYLAESYLRTNELSKAIREWRIVEKMAPEYPSNGAPAKTASAQLKLHAKPGFSRA